MGKKLKCVILGAVLAGTLATTACSEGINYVADDSDKKAIYSLNLKQLTIIGSSTVHHVTIKNPA